MTTTLEEARPVKAPPAATPPAVKKAEVPVDWTQVVDLPLDRIEHGRNPRTVLELPRQKELAESIRQHGVLMPIRVRPISEGKFQIIAGHRRYEAAKAAKIGRIPVVIALPDEQTAFVQSLVENLQRADLDPIDEATAFKAVLAETKWTQETLGGKVGRSQAYIANSLRLLGLEPEVKAALTSGQLTTSHAKALVGLAPERQKAVAAMVVADKLPSRQVEQIVADAKQAQREDEARKERETLNAKAATEAVAKFIAKAKVEPKALTIYSTSSELVMEALKATGVTLVRPKGWGEIHGDPPYECACKGKMYEYDTWRGLIPICAVAEHMTAYRKERETERRKANEKAVKSTDVARAAIRKHLGDGEGLSPDGKRAVLYAILTSRREVPYGEASPVDAAAFVKRYGGAPRTSFSGDLGDVWEVVQGMTLEDVVTETVKYLAASLQPNVWRENASGQRADWKFREYLVGKKVLDKSATWGPSGVPKDVLEADQRRLTTATEAAAKAAAKAEAKAVSAKPEKKAATDAATVTETVKPEKKAPAVDLTTRAE